MKIRTLVLILALPLWWQCTSPPPSRPMALGNDDDHRLVSREDFAGEGGWTPAAPAASWKQEGQTVVLTLTDGRQMSVRFLSPRVFRLWFAADPRTAPYQTAVQTTSLNSFSLKTAEEGNHLTLDSGELTLTIDKTSLGWEVRQGESLVLKTSEPLKRLRGRVLQALSWAPEAPVYGLGISGSGLDKRGQSVKFWNDKPGNPDETAPFSAPYLLSVSQGRSFALFMDNSYQTYINLKKDRTYLGSLNGGFDLYFIAGENPKEVVKTTSTLLGKPALPPQWALNAQGTEPALPEGLAAMVDVKNTDIGPQISPARDTGWVKESAAENLFVSEVPDFTRPEARSWWAQKAPLAVQNRSVWNLGSVWPSVGWDTRFWDEGRTSPLAKIHNTYPGLAAQAAREAQSLRAPANRPWLTVQTGFAGQAQAATLALEVHPGQDDKAVLDRILSVGLGGQPACQVELEVSRLGTGDEKAWRSLSLWVLTPYLSLKTGQPAAWWSALGTEGQRRLKTLLALHSTLKPLFYTLVRQASLEGLPVLRPLFLEFPQDSRSSTVDDEFMVGENLLAAPALDGGASRQVYLPGTGIWFDWYSGREYTGGQELEVHIKDGKTPLFVRGGSLIPLREPEFALGSAVFNPVTVHLWPAGAGTLNLYQDDGFSQAFTQGQYRETKVTFSSNSRQMAVEQESLSSPAGYRKADPYTLYRLHNVYRPREVRVAHRLIPLYGDSFGVTDSDQNAAWYENDQTLLVKLFRPEASQTVDIYY